MRKKYILKPLTNSLDPQVFLDLGISPQETAVYLTLLKNNSLTAKQIAETIGSLPHAVYRVAKRLKMKNLIGISKRKPTSFQALPLTKSLPSLVEKKIENLQKINEKLLSVKLPNKIPPSPTKINLIYGKEEIYLEGAKMPNKTSKEILIISIGENIPPELLLANKRASERGVLIRMIVHKYDQKNKEVLENFKKNGYEIRYYQDSGFHLAIYDAKESLLIINNPENTDERMAIQIFSTGLSKAFRDYFYSVWEKAVRV